MSEIVKAKKNTGIKAERAATEEPNADYQKKEDKKGGSKWQPLAAVINVSDLRQTTVFEVHFSLIIAYTLLLTINHFSLNH